MASIRNRGPYQWFAEIRRKGYPTARKTFNTKAEAQAWVRETESAMDHGRFCDPGLLRKTTLADALKRYDTEVSAKKRGGFVEAQRINRWLKHPLAVRTLGQIRAGDFALYRDQRLAAGISGSTIRLDLAIIRHMYNVARKEWGMEGLANPIDAITLPSPGRPRNRRLTVDEFDALLGHLHSARNKIVHDIVVLARETAMRQGEILAIHYELIDFDARVLCLPITKNGEERLVPLSTQAMEVLKRHKPSGGTGRVFDITSNALRLVFNRALARAQIEDFRFHDLRHEAVSSLFERGFNTMEVASVSGHKTLQMLKRYTHLRAADIAKRLG